MIRPSRLMLGIALLAISALSARTARAADPDKLIPANADTVISINLKQLLGSDFVKKYVLDEMKKQLEKDEAKQLFADIGLDPLKDIEQLVVASIDTKFKNGAEPSYVLVVRGSFDAQKLFKRAEAETKANEKFSMVKDGGITMFKFQQDKDKPGLYFTVADEKTVVAASEQKYITDAIKVVDSGQAAPLKKELAALIKKVDPKVSIYIASVVSGKLGDLKLPNEAGPVKLQDLSNALPNAETALITIKVGTDVILDIIVGMKNEEAANDMRNALIDMIEQVKPLAKLAANIEPQAKALPEMLDAIKITSKEKDRILTFKAAGSDIGTLLEIPRARQKKKN